MRLTGIAVVAALVLLAVAARIYFRAYAFTAWVLVGVGAALCYPGAIQSWGLVLGLALPCLVTASKLVITLWLQRGDSCLKPMGARRPCHPEQSVSARPPLNRCRT